MELVTAAESEAAQRKVAGALQARGLQVGDRVALVASSSADLLAAVLGALRVGIVPVPLNPALLDHERDALVADAQPALVVGDATLARLLDGPPTDLAPVPLARPMHYTSGTTGTPKGVWSGVLDERAAAALVSEEREQWGFEPGDRHLVCSPFHHSVAIRFAAGTLLAGGEIVVLGRFDADAAVRALVELAPTTTFMVPAHLQRLFATGVPPRPAPLRLVAHAGAPCPPPLKRLAMEAFGSSTVWEFYGATEGQFTACSAREWEQRPGTVGRARAHRRLHVEAPHQPAPGDDAGGTIWCEVPAHARFEYWRDPVKTAQAWRGDAFTVGDLGRLDADGYLFLDGRRDDLIITGGVNVYPAEVEGVLSVLEGVAQVAVFGVADERWGQRVCAAVVGEVDLDDVAAFARARLAPFKRPKDLFRVDELPHTATGKLQRNRVAELVGLSPRPSRCRATRRPG